MDSSKKKKLLIISGAILAIGAIITTIIVLGKKSSTNTNPWIRFNWWGGQKAKKWDGSGYTDLGWSAVGFQLSNPSQLPAGLKPGSVVEVNMEQGSDPSFNGNHTVMYLGDDTKPGDFASGLGALVTVDFPRPDPPTTLPKSGYFRLVSL